MTICPRHFHDIERAIKSRGLWDLVPHTPAHFAACVRACRSGRPLTLQTFDPLNYVIGVIVWYQRNCAKEMPAWVITAEQCPLCEHFVPFWIHSAADSAHWATANLSQQQPMNKEDL